MGATIYYQPVKGKRLQVGAPSSLLSKLREAFHAEGEIRLTDWDYHTLIGLRAGIDSTDAKEALDELAKAVMEHSEVRVWAEY